MSSGYTNCARDRVWVAYAGPREASDKPTKGQP
jgi:hypothetical protein